MCLTILKILAHIFKNKNTDTVKVLDKQKKGYLESEELTKYLTQEGKEEVYSLHIHVT